MDNPPATNLVVLTIDGSRANLRLNREDKFNALNVQLITELCDVLDWTAERSAGRQDALADENGAPYLRSLVLSGEGRHFCAGADINMMRDAGANTPEENRADSKRLDRLFNSLGCFDLAIIVFSDMQTSHRLVPHLYGCACAVILHLMEYCTPLSFKLHINFESSDSFSWLLNRNDVPWPL